MTLGLRPPTPLDPDAALYKDWLHLNIFEPASGLIALVNVAVHGWREDARGRAVGTALAYLPDHGWVGNVDVRPLGEAAVLQRLLALGRVALGADEGDGDVHAAATMPDDRLHVTVRARPDAAPFAPRARLPFGRGWMRWEATPRLRPRGDVRIHERTIDLAGGVAYFDHNWGRWRWGDDAGWEFGCFADPQNDLVLVFSRITDRNHLHGEHAHVLIQWGKHRRHLAGPGVVLDRGGRLRRPLRRVPGALAALHGDRARPSLPAQVSLHAADGYDDLRLRFTPQEGVQVIVAEVSEPGYGFVHELAGTFTLSGRLGGTLVSAAGLGLFEHVD